MNKLRVTVISRRSRKPIRTVTVSNLEEAVQASKEFPGQGHEETTVFRHHDGTHRVNVVWPDLGESYQYGIVEKLPGQDLT